MDAHAQAHRTLRKLIYLKHEPYPHVDPTKKIVDRVSYFFGVVTPLFSIPQIYEIWHHENAAGVSLLSWSAFTVASIFWVYYGLIHKELPIIISQALWLILQLFIVIGIVLYR